jgi:hypothetical protein
MSTTYTYLIRTINGKFDIKAVPLSLTPSQYQPLLSIISSKSPWGIYDAASWNSSTNTLPELRGNGRNVTSTGTIVSGKASGNGAAAAISYIQGNTASTLSWPTGSIPSIFTICTISRYNNGTNGRVVQSTNTLNWLHGHWGGQRGVAHYNSWMTTSSNTANLQNWLVMCGKNNATNPNNILADSVAVGTAAGGAGNGQLCINVPYEQSDWQFSYAIIWDQTLTDAEMLSVSNALQYYLTSGIKIM